MKEEDDLIFNWQTKKMLGNMSEADNALSFVRGSLFGVWDDTQLKTLRAWINRELARRRDRREHPLETKYR